MEMDESETESSIQERTEEIIEDETNHENERNVEDEISENEGKIDEIDSDLKSGDFSDYSDDSDLTDDDSISEFKTEEEETREDVFDKIIDAFTVKRRKPYFDQEDQDLVDFEESRKRLFILAIISATILGAKGKLSRSRPTFHTISRIYLHLQSFRKSTSPNQKKLHFPNTENK